MKHLKLILIFIILLSCKSTLLAQPYIYFSKVIDSTDSNPMYWDLSINKFNLKNNLEEPFLYNAEFISYTWDRTQTWLILDHLYSYSHIYNCLDTLNNFDLPAEIEGGVFPVLYSKEKNTLFITGVLDEKLKMFEFNVNTKDFSQSFEEFPQIIHNNKEGMFFSSSEEKVYVPVLDTNYSGMGKLLIYSTTSKHILSISELSVYGYPNADGYILFKGEDGIAVILSYIHNITKDSYFRVYNFDSDLGSNFIKYQGFADPYFTNNGKYLILSNIYDSLNAYSGKLDIYSVGTGECIKTILLPSGGEIYTFDEFPNHVYYAIDIEEPIRQIYTLKMDSIFNVLDLTALNPSSDIINSSPFTLTVYGHGFDSLSTVYFNGSIKPTTFFSDSVLNAEISTSDIENIGNYPVWVTDQWATSDTLIFAVAPTITSITPEITLMPEIATNSLYTPEFDFILTVTGYNFTKSTVIYFNGIDIPSNFISDSVINCEITADYITQTGNYPVWADDNEIVSDTSYLTTVDTLQEAITPILNCVRSIGEGNYIAYLGYSNNSISVHIPYGEKNRFGTCSPYDLINRGQPNVFMSGTYSKVFSIEFTQNSWPLCSDYYNWRLYLDNVNAADIGANPCDE